METLSSKEERIRELQDAIASSCLRCPQAKWYCGWVECKGGRRHFHLNNVHQSMKELEEKD